MQLKVKKLHPNAILPTRGSELASGLDLYSLETVKIRPGETVIIKTGIAFGIPSGHEIQVRARSGLSAKTKLRVANGVGTVDADYTGDCSVIFDNIGKTIETIQAGTRIAQAVLCAVEILPLVEVDDLAKTIRSNSGFGSTGV